MTTKQTKEAKPLNCLLHIGNIIDKDGQANLSTLIRDVFDNGFRNHVSDEVLIAALGLCKDAYAVDNVTVQGSTFTGKTDD